MLRLPLLIVLVISGVFAGLNAQDAHYWTQQYGTKSMLLSGSVIGGVEDLGAVFYNPGRLGLIENPAFLLSADVYEWQKLTIEDAVGEEADFSRSDFGGVPSLVAGTFKLSFLEEHSFAYAVLQRQRMNVDFTYRNETEGELIDVYPGEEIFGGKVNSFQNVKEEWACLAWSYPFSDKLSIGLTTNLVIFNQRKGNIIELQALTSSRQTAVYRYNRNFSLNKYGLLWKLGMAAELGKVNLGLTVTTPQVGLFGKGSYEFAEFFAGIPEYNAMPDRYTTSSQSDLPVKLAKPWAIGAGATVLVGKNKIHTSAEWYSKVPYFVMLESNPHVSQSGGDTLSFTLYDELRSTINFGIGLEFFIKEKVSLYTSFSTDFSVAPKMQTLFSQREDVAVNSVIQADFYHFGGGFVLKLKGADITLGATHTGATQTFARPINFPEDGGDDEIFESDENGKIKWTRWRLVFSFSVPFFSQKLEEFQNRSKE